MSSSIRGKKSWHNDRRRRRCAAYHLDQAPGVPLQCLHLPQLGVVHPHVQHDRSNALVTFQDQDLSGICTETQRTWAPGKQWVCILPSANVAWTCRTMETPMITASHPVLQRGTKRLRVEISKTRGGEVIGAWIASSAAVPRVRGFPALEWRTSGKIASRMHGACSEKHTE